MKPLLRAELIKLRTTRTFAGLAGAAIGISLLITVLVGVLTEPTEDSVLVDVFTTDLSGFFIFILAVIGIGGEWRHRTITSSLLAAPDRLRFLAAKTLAFAAAGAVLSVLVSIAVTIVGTLVTVAARPAAAGGRRAGRPAGPQRARRRAHGRARRSASAPSCATRSSPSSGCSCSRSWSSRL